MIKSVTGRELPSPNQSVRITGIETMNLPESWDKSMICEFKKNILNKYVVVCTSGTSGDILTCKTIARYYGDSEVYMTIDAKEVAFKESVYIAGPITGYDNKNKPDFERVEKLLKEMGYFPVNPHNLDHSEAERMEAERDNYFKGNPLGENPPYTFAEIHAKYMNTDLKALLECEAITLLRGWDKSVGANVEYNTAKATGKKIIDML